VFLTQGSATGILHAAVHAGQHSLRLSRGSASDLDEQSKADGSPVTRADIESQAIIVESLGRGFPDIPVLGEEGEHAPAAERAGYREYFVIDPIDGTKGFLEGKGEFAVCIGYVHDGRVRFGLVYSPATDEAVMGEPGTGLCVVESASRRSDDDALTVVSPDPQGSPDSRGQSLTERLVEVIASRHNMDAVTRAWIDALGARTGGVSLTQAGSARKFMSIARNTADVYPRFSPCSQWDIAAGHAIVEASGGLLIDADTGAVPRYRADSLPAPRFVAWSRKGLFLAASVQSMIDSA
jgi:3'(2'), 5'-bisphosphate nucleotidase